MTKESTNTIQPQQRSKRKIFLLVLTFFFVICEILSAYAVAIHGNGDIVGSFIKSILLLILIFLCYQKFNWAKWVLSVLLFLYSAGCFLSGFENDSLILKLVGCYFLYFSLILHFSSSLKKHFRKEKVEANPAGDKPMPTDSFVRNNREFDYPRLIRRYQALLIDSLLIMILMVLSVVLTSDMEQGALVTRIIYFTFVLSYEPILTSRAATLGQRIVGIRVRKISDPDQKISVIEAYLRFVVKGILGWLSFLIINFNDEHRAIHDYLASSVVVKVGNKKSN